MNVTTACHEIYVRRIGLTVTNSGMGGVHDGFNRSKQEGTKPADDLL